MFLSYGNLLQYVLRLRVLLISKFFKIVLIVAIFVSLGNQAYVRILPDLARSACLATVAFQFQFEILGCEGQHMYGRKFSAHVSSNCIAENFLLAGSFRADHGPNSGQIW